MSTMSDIAAEREEALQEANMAYRGAFDDYMDYLEKHPLGSRTPEQSDELMKLEYLCAKAKGEYDDAKYRRYRI